MKITTYRIEKRPIERKPVTLADMPEGVECVVQSTPDGFKQVRKLIEGQPCFTDGDRSCSYPSAFTVVQRLDGEPLPQPNLPATLADEGVEEGRLYLCDNAKCTLHGVSSGVVYAFSEYGHSKSSFGPDSYKITGITDSVVVREEVEVTVI